MKEHEKYDLRMLWNKLNISQTLFLKLLEVDIMKTAVSRKYSENVKYPIHYLALDYGLLGTYISKDLNNLHLIFDKELATSNLNLTTASYENFIDRLIDSRHYHSTNNFINTKNGKYSSLLKVTMKIPGKYRPDIKMITKNSSYSKVSLSFKTAMKKIGKYVPETEHKVARYLVLENIPEGIVLKSNKLRTNIQKIFGMSKEEASKTLTINTEYYTAFDPGKEYYYESNLDKYI